MGTTSLYNVNLPANFPRLRHSNEDKKHHIKVFQLNCRQVICEEFFHPDMINVTTKGGSYGQTNW